MDPWSINTLLVCFGGGILGAALGGLFAFVLCGLIVLIGCLIILGGGSDFVLLQVGLGPIFGPHVGGFISGVVAVTYAVGVKKNLASESAKDILSPLVDTSWDVLFVGGIAALIGHTMLNFMTSIPIIKMFDCIALSVVISCMWSRLLFLKEAPWGKKESIDKIGWLKTDNYAISWIPWEAVTSRLIILSFGVGIFSGAIAMGTKQVLEPLAANGTISTAGAFVVPLIMGWSFAAISLIALNLGTGEIQKFPAWHCQAILGALAFLYFGSVFIAGVVGLLGGLLQELMARMFWNHGSNHVDPPACAITVGTFILNVVSKFGV